MATPTSSKSTCATCHKHGDIFMCRGCRLSFCEKHVDEHRTHLSKEIEHLIDDFEVVRRDFDQDDEVQSLLSILNNWEHQSIAKICLTTETARVELNEWSDRNHQVKHSFEQILNEIQNCQKSEDFNEIDLKRWTKQLEDFRHQVESVPNLQPIDDDETIHLIKLNDHLDQSQYSHMNHSTPSMTPSIYSFQDLPSVLVRERFDDVHGPSSLYEDGLVVTYSGKWLGQASVCGINLYSSGTHHIRFRIEEKFYDSPFFGIITASQKNTGHILDTISANGWINFEYPIVNGNKEYRVGRDKLIRTSDEITLTLDCERRQIFLKHHRSKRLLHLPIDLRSCPFPWKMLIVLHRRADSVRIVGGTLSVTRENLSSRLSEQRPS